MSMSARRRAASGRRAESGSATLGVALLLMMLLTMAVLYAHRGLLFEQRSAANQYRAAQAFELAEAGLEWGAAMLNDPRRIDAACRPAAGLGPFRQRYIAVDVDGNLQSASDGRPACHWGDAGMTCACPMPGGTEEPGDRALPSFGLSLDLEAGAKGLVRLSARGCTGGGASCVAEDAPVDSEGTARSSVMLQWLPGLRTMPVAALTTGGSVRLDGDVAVSNQDASGGGRLVHAGADVTVAGTVRLKGPAGTPVASLLLRQDETLAKADLTVALIGTTVDAWTRRAGVHRVAGESAAERGAALLDGYAQGYRAFHADGDVTIDAERVGSPDEPLLLVSGHRVTCERPCRWHGLLYGDVAMRPASDLKHVTVRGAMVTRGDHEQGDGGVEYDAGTLERLRMLTGIFAKVPGSWRDF
jgi:hypothetical protein